MNYKYIIWGGWILFYYIMALSNVADGTSIKHTLKKNILFLQPQGWAFFTRDPNEAIVDAYKVVGGKTELVTYQNASIDNYFGLSRVSRGIGFELSQILPLIPRSAWENGVGNLANHHSSKRTRVKLRQQLIHFSPGEYVIHQYKIIPKEWAGQGQEQYRPFLYARIALSN